MGETFAVHVGVTLALSVYALTAGDIDHFEAPAAYSRCSTGYELAHAAGVTRLDVLGEQESSERRRVAGVCRKQRSLGACARGYSGAALTISPLRPPALTSPLWCLRR